VSLEEKNCEKGNAVALSSNSGNEENTSPRINRLFICGLPSFGSEINFGNGDIIVHRRALSIPGATFPLLFGRGICHNTFQSNFRVPLKIQFCYEPTLIIKELARASVEKYQLLEVPFKKGMEAGIERPGFAG
jgi:hypothetical protein